MAAVKKDAQNTQDDAQQAATAETVKDTAEREKAATKPQSGAGVEYKKFVYVGPTLPRGALKHSAIFEGTMEEITAYLAEVLEEYPQAKRLIVPVHRLGEASAKAQTQGNILHKYYNDIVSAVNSRKKEG